MKNAVEMSKVILFIAVCVAALSSCRGSESEIERLMDEWVGEWQIVSQSNGRGEYHMRFEGATGTYTFREDGSYEHSSGEKGIFVVSDERFMLALMKEDGERKGYFGTWMMSKHHLYLEFYDLINNSRWNSQILKRM